MKYLNIFIFIFEVDFLSVRNFELFEILLLICNTRVSDILYSSILFKMLVLQTFEDHIPTYFVVNSFRRVMNGARYTYVLYCINC